MPARVDKNSVIGLAHVDDGAQVPLGPLASLLTRVFDAEVVPAPEIPLPLGAWDPARQQYRASTIVEVLATVKKPEWDRLLGVATVDLYAPSLNFVFGEADPHRGVAVFSLARLRNGASLELLRRRAAIEAIHELGHTYGLAHCSDPSCVMWFSNTLAESDRKGPDFCRAHADMLRAARGRKNRGTRSRELA